VVISNTTLVKIVILVLKTYEIYVNLNLDVVTVSSIRVKTATIVLKIYEICVMEVADS
jgi:hypothetical protein